MKDFAAKWATWAADTHISERWILEEDSGFGASPQTVSWAALDDNIEYQCLLEADSGFIWSTEVVIWAARDGNIEHLAHRLRKGLASREEMGFVADLIEGKVKSRHPRRGQLTKYANDRLACAVFQLQMAYPDWPEKKIKGMVADMFSVTERHVYNVLEALNPESRKRHEERARNAVEFYREMEEHGP